MIVRVSTAFEALMVDAPVAQTVVAIVVNPPSSTALSTTSASEGPAGVYSATITAPAVAGEYLILWQIDGESVASEELTATGSAPPPPSTTLTFASADDVRVRLARATFSDDEETHVEMLLNLVANRILEEVDQAEAWAVALEAVPSAFRTTSIEAVARVLLNPNGVRSQQRMIGRVTLQQSWADVSASLDLTDREIERCRRAVFGLLSAGVPVASQLDRTGARIGLTGAAVYGADRSSLIDPPLQP